MVTVIARTSLLPASPALVDSVERLRLSASGRLDARRRAELGQFLTPAPLARFMAGLLSEHRSSFDLLDPGSGVGSLFAAVVEELCRRQTRPDRIRVTAYEVDPSLIH